MSLSLHDIEGILAPSPPVVPTRFSGLLTKQEIAHKELLTEKSFCLYCGECETPNECVRAVPCYRCWAAVGIACVNPENYAYPMCFHPERWDLHGTRFPRETATRTAN